MAWDINSELGYQSTLRGCPPGQTYVPESLQARVTEWAHVLSANRHPEVLQTVSILTLAYWWPGMAEVVTRAVQSCSMCAMLKVSGQTPAGKLIPQMPWSHIAVDFVMDLPVLGRYIGR